MTDRRLDVAVDAERYARLETLARQRDTTIEAVVREAIDRRLDDSDSRRALAGARLRSADPMPLPASVSALREELALTRRGR
jgi:hypothetical protein